MTSRQESINRLRRQIANAERMIAGTDDADIKSSKASAIRSWSEQIQRLEDHIRRDPTWEERQAEDVRHWQTSQRIIAKDPTGINIG